MVLSKDSKKEILKDLIVKLKESKGVVLTDYQGMNVSQISSLRNELKEKKVEFKIVKNTLIEKASKELNVDDLTKDLIGCTAMAFCSDDGIAPAKLLKEYFKKNKIDLKIKSGLIDGRVFSPEKIIEIASLPSKDVLIAQMINGVKSPLYSLVFILQGPLRGLIYTLEAVKKQKEKAKAS
ncbi:MAG: 50S ribosomal protein L10 [Candidatus Atribacteria bacterium]|nr:50S ribosomal protein L10 [Candidatus Atribacteria bacterium]MBE3092618.1 50S ribosomal protein L10 [Chloroflexota bacterium]MBE3127343.1 50S ribosomal protein L10 [Candidatus Atribacteria bacterium]